DGSFIPISTTDLLDEVAERLTKIVDRYGPRAVAAYRGTFAISDPPTAPFVDAFMRGIGSPMIFSPNTIDKPGRAVAAALHGNWMAPVQGYDRPDVALLVGLNPYQSHYGVACGNPGKWLGERLEAGMALIVIDPRRTDIAKRATLHIQPVPGEDPAL